MSEDKKDDEHEEKDKNLDLEDLAHQIHEHLDASDLMELQIEHMNDMMKKIEFLKGRYKKLEQAVFGLATAATRPISTDSVFHYQDVLAHDLNLLQEMNEVEAVKGEGAEGAGKADAPDPAKKKAS